MVFGHIEIQVYLRTGVLIHTEQNVYLEIQENFRISRSNLESKEKNKRAVNNVKQPNPTIKSWI